MGPTQTEPFIAPQDAPSWLDRSTDARVPEALLASPCVLEPEAPLALEAVRSAVACMRGVNPGTVALSPTPASAVAAIVSALPADRPAVLSTSPVPEPIAQGVRSAGGELRTLPWIDDGLPTAELATGVAQDVGAIVISSPQQITGNWADVEALIDLAKMNEEVLLVVDTSLIEYAGAVDLTELWAQPNVVTIGSLAAAWGLRGLGIAYVIGEGQARAAVDAAEPEELWSVTALALAAEWVEVGAFRVRAHARRVRAERLALCALLAELGVEVLPSAAGFVLARFRTPRDVACGLAAQGVYVGEFPRSTPLGEWLKIGLPGSREQFERLCVGLLSACQPEQRAA